MFKNWFRRKEAPPSFKTKGQRIIYVIGAILALAFLSPLAVMALTTITSLAMAGVVGLGFFMFMMAVPMLLRWWRIQVLKMLKASARLNPVETLELDLMRRQEAHKLARAQVVRINGQCESLRERLEGLKAAHGRSDDSLDRLYKKLSALANRLDESVKKAGVKLGQLKAEVDFQRDRWEVAKTTGELAEMLKSVDGGDVTDQFLANTAIDSIRSELANSFAEINDILGDEEARQLVPDARLIDVTPTLSALTTSIPEPAIARR